MLLIEVGGKPKATNQVESGLYHIGFKIGDIPYDIKRAHKELQEKGVTMLVQVIIPLPIIFTF